MKRWYDFRARASGAEILIYDEIGAFGVPAKAFIDELKALGPLAELTLRINSPGGSVFDGVAIYNALERHGARVTVWIDGIAASIASMVAMAGDEIVMPENAMLMLHDPSGVVMGTAQDMRTAAEALDRMKAGMVAAYRAKSGRADAEIEALMAAETWLSAQEAHAFGLADRIEQPARMAAHFDLSRFRHPPPQLAAIAATTTSQEDEMPDPQQKKPRTPDPTDTPPARSAATEANDDASDADASVASEPAEVTAAPAAAEPPAAPAVTAVVARAAAPAPQPTAQVIDLDAVRAEERRATLAYVAEVHELCTIAGRGELAGVFVAKATPVAQVRRALLEARAAEDEASAIRGQMRPALTEAAQPTIDTAAIYAARNQHCR